MNIVATLAAGVAIKEDFGLGDDGRVYLYGSDKQWHEVKDKKIASHVREQIARAEEKKPDAK